MPTALLSVYDKSGVVELATALHDLGWTLVSSGGTAATIAATGVPVTDVADLTGFPAILGHRVVTLHPKVHGGILADLDDEAHRADLAEYGIEPISLVVVNLYPFTSDPGIELIDIGGPALVRAAAKNHAHVGVVVDPCRLRARRRRDPSARWADRTRRGGGSLATRSPAPLPTTPRSSPGSTPAIRRPTCCPAPLHLALERAQPLRYGENPHQQGARYRAVGRTGWWDAMTQHGGKELSYLNLYDTEAAWRLVHRFDDTACVIVKHANPCGVAIGDDVADAYVKANACDPVSAFGGIVAVNRHVTNAMATALAPVFTEVVVAPGLRRGRAGHAGRTQERPRAHRHASLAGAVRRTADRRRVARAGTRRRQRRPRRLARRDRG